MAFSSMPRAIEGSKRLLLRAKNLVEAVETEIPVAILDSRHHRQNLKDSLLLLICLNYFSKCADTEIFKKYRSSEKSVDLSFLPAVRRFEPGDSWGRSAKATSVLGHPH